MWGGGYGTSLEGRCPLYWIYRAPEAHMGSVRYENLRKPWDWAMVILPCRGVWLWWQICSHFIWKTGGRADLPLVAFCSEDFSFLSFTSPFAPCCFLWSFITGGNSPALHGIISVGFSDGPFGTPANRTAWNSPCSPPRWLVQQRLQAGCNSNTISVIPQFVRVQITGSK